MAENQAKMGGEDDDHKHGGGYGYGAKRTCAMLVAALLVLSGITALTLWLVYRPHKPKFTLISATIYDLNTTSTLPFISITMQFTILTRNPYRRLSILYDHLSAYVSYNNQMITQAVMLPALYHDKESTVRISPIVGGVAVQVSMEVRNGLIREEAYGVVGLRVVLLGKLRWKAGGITTSHYSVYVRCDMMVGFNKGLVAQLPLLASPPCHVDI